MGNFNCRSQLNKIVWEKVSYTKKSSTEFKKDFFNNQAQVKLYKYSQNVKTVLDCGCGDGRIIEILWRRDVRFFGIDISTKAISLAKSRFNKKKNIVFKIGDVQKVDFPDESFDLVYSNYTLEHLDDPEKAIEEMIRLVRKNGWLVIICPNFGSPFHPSPSSPPKGETLLSRALKTFIISHLYLIKRPIKLEWNEVYPKALVEGSWKSDWDTVIEPYIQTLLVFLKKRNIDIIESASGLTWDDKEVTKSQSNVNIKTSFKQKMLAQSRMLFEYLGRLGISPYKYYGPTIFVVGRKK